MKRPRVLGRNPDIMAGCLTMKLLPSFPHVMTPSVDLSLTRFHVRLYVFDEKKECVVGEKRGVSTAVRGKIIVGLGPYRTRRNARGEAAAWGAMLVLVWETSARNLRLGKRKASLLF